MACALLFTIPYACSRPEERDTTNARTGTGGVDEAGRELSPSTAKTPPRISPQLVGESGSTLDEATPEAIEPRAVGVDGKVQLASEGIPAYLPQVDSVESGSIIQIPKNPFHPGLPSVVIASHGSSFWQMFISGTIVAANAKLVIVPIKAENQASNSRSFLVGDVGLYDSQGREAPCVALAKGDSYWVAKTGEAARRILNSTLVVVKKEATINLTYCFAVPSQGYPYHLRYRGANMGTIRDETSLTPYEKAQSSAEAWFAGSLKLSVDMSGRKVEGHSGRGDPRAIYRPVASFNFGGGQSEIHLTAVRRSTRS
jgi:hypothetical protein